MRLLFQAELNILRPPFYHLGVTDILGIALFRAMQGA
jgi:hypothetical protein